jgi:cytochrome c peroxidase
VTPRFRKLLTGICLLLAGYSLWQNVPAPLPRVWSSAELATLQSLALQSLPPVPADPGNAVADNPQAAALGGRLFFDTRLSASGQVSCATCHQPALLFTDGLARAVGMAQVDRSAMSLVGAAYSPWLYWDGRKDSLWSQALEPLENPREHGSNRVDVARLLLTDPVYRPLYDALFPQPGDLALRIADAGQFPAASPLGDAHWQAAWHALAEQDQHHINQVFSNAGKALAAWQRQLQPGAAAFDEYVARLATDAQVLQPDSLTRAELAGLRLFIGKAQCVNCHNGPLFTNNAFHNTAVLNAPGVMPSSGRSRGLRLAQADVFNCLGPYSDAAPQDCQELRFARGGDEMRGAQRTPGLRNLAATAPYMHAGQIATLEDVIEHYDRAELALLGHNEAKPLGLRAVEKRQLRAFLDSLNGGVTSP